MIKYFAILPAVIALASCATSETPSDDSIVPVTTWQDAKNTIVLTPGPRTTDSSVGERSYSYYTVKRTTPEVYNLEQLLAESGLDDQFPNDPMEVISVVHSESFNTVLITEDIPNDCCPTFNYILFRYKAGKWRSEYLAIPSRFGEENNKLREFPVIEKLSDSHVTFSYTDGVRKNAAIATIKRRKRPLFPGE